MLLAFLLMPLALFGDDGISQLPTDSLIGAILAFAGKLTGGSVTVALVVLGVVQVGVVLFRTTIGKSIAGIWTLGVLYVLNAAVVVLLGAVNGIPIAESVGSSVFLSFAMNAVNEILKHVFDKTA